MKQTRTYLSSVLHLASHASADVWLALLIVTTGRTSTHLRCSERCQFFLTCSIQQLPTLPAQRSPPTRLPNRGPLHDLPLDFPPKPPQRKSAGEYRPAPQQPRLTRMQCPPIILKPPSALIASTSKPSSTVCSNTATSSRILTCLRITGWILRWLKASGASLAATFCGSRKTGQNPARLTCNIPIVSSIASTLYLRGTRTYSIFPLPFASEPHTAFSTSAFFPVSASFTPLKIVSLGLNMPTRAWYAAYPAYLDAVIPSV
jgi:hypothetical protein